MKKMCVTIFTILILSITVVSSGNFIEAHLNEIVVFIDGMNISKDLKNPLITYNDRTYISVRDMAEVIDRKVNWDEKSQTIVLSEKPIAERTLMINNYETVYVIGKAIIQEHFSNQVNDSTRYTILETVEDHLGSTPLYSVYAMFDAPPDIEDNSIEVYENADCEILIDSATGNIRIKTPGNMLWE